MSDQPPSLEPQASAPAPAVNAAQAAADAAERERQKQATRSIWIFLAILLPFIVAFWVIHIMFDNPVLAIVILGFGLSISATYFVAQSVKLRPKDK